MVATVREWRDADLRMEEVEDGLLVSQVDRTYLARRWRLSPRLYDYVELALEHGLKYVIQWDRQTERPIHPREANLNVHRGVQYIGFSRNKYGRWVVGIDQFSGRPDIKEVVCEKAYHRYIEKSGARWVWETHGGQNIRLPFEDLPLFLDHLNEQVIRDVELGLGKHDRTRARIARTAIITEDDLQRVFVEAIREGGPNSIFGRITQYREKPQFGVRQNDRFVSITQKALIPDVVLFGRDTCFIVELKKGSAGLAEVQQLLAYTLCEGACTWAGERSIKGVLVAARYSDAALQKASHLISSGSPLSLYTFSFQGALALTAVMSNAGRP